MLKREIKRIKNRFVKFADPIGLVVLSALFILPTLAVLNLSPHSKNTPVNVLGADDGKGVAMVMVGGTHDIIKEEIITFPTDKQTEFTSKIIKAGTGRYSKPIIQVVNFDSTEAEIQVSAQTSENAHQRISVVLNGMEYILQDEDGKPTIQSISIPKSSKNDLYLVIKNTNDILFNNDVTLTLVGK